MVYIGDYCRNCRYFKFGNLLHIFINPSTIEVIIPSRLKLLQETEQLIKFDPNEVLNNSALKNEPQVKIIIPEPALNPNPFLR